MSEQQKPVNSQPVAKIMSSSPGPSPASSDHRSKQGTGKQDQRTSDNGSKYLSLPLSGEHRKSGELRKTMSKLSNVSKNRVHQQNPLGGMHNHPSATATPSPRVRNPDPFSDGDGIPSILDSLFLPPNVSLLQGTEHLFLRKCKDNDVNAKETFNRSHFMREIINSSGRVIYYCTQTVDKWYCFRHEFAYNVVDYNGRTAIMTSGRQIIPGVKASATIYQSDGQILGTVSQDFCDAGYTVNDNEGRPMFRIRGPCYGSCTPCVFWCFEEHFEIDLEDGVTDSGMISTDWSKSHPENNGMFGLRFPLILENYQKALLMGAAFLIHLQYFRRGGNGSWICFFLFLLMLGLSYPIYYYFGRTESQGEH